eukprot:gnl/TRDRNA2_/TRDRNA2_43236_c0_seq1.p1 gnl/TRDRNA2_/TRDRNA2_43236_c0~~gnl/TRDRNA2_/TRDRNA2_43236_c0_seq1.p1  ORF type:complete len:321 (-),score=62.15 gnl/TRDRNA2_/TRDRNA2_43236_c0_seq1:151-1113(-)
MQPSYKRPRYDESTSSKLELRVLIPEETASRVIGDKGNTIGGIAKSTNCLMHVGRESYMGTPTRVLACRPKGSGANLAGAAIEGLRVAFEGADTIHCSAIIPEKAGPLLIGKRGSRVQELQQSTGCSISTKRPPPGCPDEEVSISGRISGVAEVLQAVVRSLEVYRGDDGGGSVSGGSWQSHDSGGYHSEAKAPRQYHERSGEADAHASAFSDGGRSLFTSQGGEGEEGVDEAVLSSNCVVKLQLPQNLHMGSVLGKGGGIMKELKQSSGAKKLHVADEADGRWLEIHGTVAQVQVAQFMMLRRMVLLQAQAQEKHMPEQ